MNQVLAIALSLPIALCVVAIMLHRPRRSMTAVEPFADSDPIMDGLPETITLSPLTGIEPRAEVERIARQLCESGFQDAGAFQIEGIPGTHLRMLSNQAHSLYAMIGMHPGGSWVEMWCSYPNGQRVTYTTLRGRGFEGRPGTTVVRLPNATPLELFSRLCWERPMGVYLPVSKAQAAPEFEKAYALWVAWRRAQDPSRTVREQQAA